jgi:hypothetical protein
MVIQHNEIWQELKDLDSLLAEMPRLMPYAVPVDYPDRMSEALAEGVAHSQIDDPIFLHSKAMPFEVPQGYFASLHEHLTKEATRGTESGRSIHFGVPENYFDDLPQTLLNAVKDSENPIHKKTAVPLRPLWKRKAIQWAAAALIVMGIGAGTYTYMYASSADAKASRELAKLDKEDIGHYISQHADEFETDMLESFIADSGEDIDKSISTLNDQEIEDYLDGQPPADTQTLN